ncbi:unnamed protein product [Jaminaea pallidilutea]
MIDNLALNPNDENIRTSLDCNACVMAKLTKAPLPQKTKTSTSSLPLEKLHVDILTQFSGHSSCRYALIIVDDATDLVYACPLSNKGQAFQALVDFVDLAEKQTGHVLKKVRSDNDSVFLSNTAMEWSASKGLEWQLTVPYDSRQNGKVERMNRTLRERMQASLLARGAPYLLWPEALEYATVTLNLTCSGNKSPYELFWERDPKELARFLQPFACLAWVFIPERKRAGGKGGPRALPAMFIGVDVRHRGWKFYSPHASPSTFWSNSARFHPELSWRDRRKMADWRDLLDHSDLFADKGNDIADLSFSPLDIIAERDQECLQYYNARVRQHVEEEAELTVHDAHLTLDEPTREHDVVTSSGWKHFTEHHSASTATAEGNTLNLTPTVREALSSNNASHWRQAIKNEMQGLDAMNTWQIVDAPANGRLVDSKLVLRIKTAPDGTPLKYKARLVARGFTQVEGVDFEETFAPVAPYTAIRTVFALAASHGWFLHSTDFTQAYLNGEIDHTVYMKPPAGSELPEGKVYKIVKGLYGLKQSGRVWNQTLDKVLRKMGFMPCNTAPCVYRKGSGDNIVILLTYVDDIAIATPSKTLLDQVKSSLLGAFKGEDKGPLVTFCGIQMHYEQDKKRLTMHQKPYVDTLLKEFLPNGGCKKTPMDSIPSPSDMDASIKATYQRLTGKFLWLASRTRPDLAFCSSIFSKHMSSPSKPAYEATTRALQYLNATKSHTLTYHPDRNLGLVAYTDANWASDPHANRKSTSGCAIFLYGALVSWRTQTQHCVTLSAVEAELVAASETLREVLFIKNLLEELDVPITPTIRTDSMGCIQVARDPAQHWRLKHIDTRYFFLRDYAQSESLNIEHVRSESNPADIFTKAVGHHVLNRHVPSLNLSTFPNSDRSRREGLFGRIALRTT